MKNLKLFLHTLFIVNCFNISTYSLAQTPPSVDTLSPLPFTEDFTQQLSVPLSISAGVPSGTSVAVTVNRFDTVTNPNQLFQPVNNGLLDFGTLQLNSSLNIFLPPPTQQFFIMDCGIQGGAGTYTLNASYVDGNNPNGSGPGLGGHSILTFVKVPFQAAEIIISKIPAVGANISINTNTFVNPPGYLRIYYGLATGSQANPAIPFSGDPAGTVPFLVSDQPGNYTGTLILTATIP